jgi:hypothetical protein
MTRTQIRLQEEHWFDSTPQAIVYSYEIYDYLVKTQRFVWVRKWIEKYTKDRFNLIVKSNVDKVKNDSELLDSLYGLEDATGYQRNAIMKAIGELQ